MARQFWRAPIKTISASYFQIIFENWQILNALTKLKSTIERHFYQVTSG